MEPNVAGDSSSRSAEAWGCDTDLIVPRGLVNKFSEGLSNCISQGHAFAIMDGNLRKMGAY